MKLKIATWNMAYWSHKRYLEGSWEYFLNEINADVFFFQEAKPSKLIKADKNLIWHNAGESVGRREWGSGIYSKKYGLSEEPEESIYTGDMSGFKEVCQVANTKIGGTKLTLISLYGRFDRFGKSPIYSVPNLHRIICDLTGILRGHVNGKRNIILGGDLNVSPQFDDKWSSTYGSSNKIFFERLDDLNLDNCFKVNGNKDFVQTHRHRGSKTPWQNDYFFISKSLSKRLANCEVIDNEKLRKYSDHNPVVITLDL